MIILTAHVEGKTALSDTCHEAANLCNRLGIGFDLTIGEHLIEVRQGDHPYNLEQAYKRAASGKAS